MVKKIVFVMGMVLLFHSSPIVFANNEKSTKEKGPVGYWKFDEGNGKIAKDSSGNGNDGEIKGLESNKTRWVTGKFGKALEFSNIVKGNDGCVVVQGMTNYDFSKGFTVEAWIWIKERPPVPGYYKSEIMGTSFGTAGPGFRFMSSRLALAMSEGGKQFWYVFGVTPQDKNVWYHVAATYDGSVMKIYSNGECVGTSEPGALYGKCNNPLTIGSHAGGKYDGFTGIIDEVKIYDYARPPGDIFKDAVLSDIDVDFKNYYQIGVPSIATEIKDRQLDVSVNVPLKNISDTKNEVKFYCCLFDPEDNVAIKSEKFDMEPGEEKNISFDSMKINTAGEYDADCYFILMKADTGEKVAISKIKIPIKYIPISINIIEPFYRNSIFATQNLEKVVLDVEIELTKDKLKDKKLVVEVKKERGGSEVFVRKEFLEVLPLNKMEFPNDEKLPYGNLVIYAALKDKNNKIITKTNCSLRKLEYKQGEVWLDRDLNWRIDGKPFFLVSGYVACKNPYFTAQQTSTQLDPADLARGIKKISNLLSYNRIPRLYFESLQRGKITEEFLNWYREQIRKEMASPGLFGYMLGDEPELKRFSPEIMKVLYDLLWEEDPYHPAYIINSTNVSARQYVNCADFILRDIYPNFFRNVKINDCSLVIEGIADFIKFTNKKQVGFMCQAFNYSDIRSEDERVPSFIELRHQNIIALTVGAKCSIAFNLTYDHYPEFYIGLPYIAQELNYLSKAVMAPGSKLEVKTDSGKIRTLLKDANRGLFLFAANIDKEARNVKFTVPGISKYSNTLYVISEDRSVDITNDSFTDKMEPFSAHVYTTSKEKTGLLSLEEIEKKIDGVNNARKKPGNLAFLMYAEKPRRVSASSGQNVQNQTSGYLWHVVDGIIDKPPMQGLDAVAWIDNNLPSWIEVKLDKEYRVSRVIVYTAYKSLKDYQVQAYISGDWKTVDTVANNSKDVITHKFEPVTTDRIRLWVTAKNVENAIVTEIEVYEK